MTAEAPLRLIYFAGKYFPGSMAVQMHRDLLDALAIHGIESTIVSLGPTTQREPVIVTVEDDRRIIRVGTVCSLGDRVLNAVSKRLWHYDFLLSGALRLARVLRHEPGDVAQGQMAFPYGTMLVMALQLARRRLPVFLNLAGGDLIASDEARYGYARFRSVRQLLRYAFARATLVRANSPVMVEQALGLGCPADKLAMVPQSIAQTFLPPADLAAHRREARAALRTKLQLGDGPVLLAAGRMLPIKGYDYLIDALAPLAARFRHIALLLVGPRVSGEEAYADALERRAESLGVRSHLHVLGTRDLNEMAQLYAASDLLLVTSLFEGLNKTAIEAASLGTPVVVTQTTGVAPYVEEYGSGRTVPARDSAALAAAVIALLDEDQAWLRAAAGAQRMAAAFTPAAIAGALLPLYARCIPASHPWRAAVARDPTTEGVHV